MQEATLYQFALCPFCNKVRAGLELKGIPYRVVEVNPRTKAELPTLPEGAPRKVPVLAVGDQVVYDSNAILRFLDPAYPSTLRFRPEDAALEARSDEIVKWTDEELIRALPTVLYGSLREAARAARAVAKSGNFGRAGGLGVQLGGSLVMHLVAKRILKKAGRTDAHAWVNACLDQIEGWLADGPFVCGPTLTTADVAIRGAFLCIQDFPIYASIEARPVLRAWAARVDALKPSASRAAPGRALAAAPPS